MGNKAKKTNRGEVPLEVYKRAAQAHERGLSKRNAAKSFGIPESTFRRYLKKLDHDQTATMGYAQHKKVFNVVMENDLAQHCIKLVRLHHGLSPDKVRNLAFEFALNNNLQVPQSWLENQKAGRSWFTSFIKRHNLSLRTPEATSLGRSISFNPTTIKLFFDNLINVMDRFSFPREMIYNIDETGCSTVQKPSRVVAPKGTKQVGSSTSAERGTLVTMIAGINAVGNSIPPYFIFPRVHFRRFMLDGAPAGSEGNAQPSGYVNEDIFVDYLKHFIQHAKCSTSNPRPTLLIMDNHSAHISLAVVELAKKYGVCLVTLYPHTSHKLQPLDRTVFGPFKRFYNNALANWMREHPNTVFSIYDVASAAKTAFDLAFTRNNILSGFRSCGICPLNPDIFTDEDFAASEVSDRPLAVASDSHTSNVNDRQRVTDCVDTEPPSTPTGLKSPEEPHDEASAHDNSETIVNVEVIVDPQTNDGTAATKYVSPKDIVPIPKAPLRNKSSRKRKKGRSLILTDTPEKLRLLKEQEEKKKKGNGHKVKHQPKKRKARSKLSKRKKEKIVESSSSSDEMVVYDESDSEFSEEFSEIEWFCEICGDSWGNSKPKEKWDQCTCSGCNNCCRGGSNSNAIAFCSKWAHLACTDTSKLYLCQMCDDK